MSGFWRWWWLIILVALATVGAAWLWQRISEPVYESSVEVELTTFSAEDVAAFREVVDRGQIREQTIEELGLQGGRARYGLETKPLGVARVLATFGARTPSLAAEIANTHVALAIEQYSDLHVSPLRARRERLENRESAVEEAVRAAEDARITFREQNDAGALETRLARLENEIADLQVTQERWQSKAATGAPDPLVETEALLAEREAEMARLIALTPAYTELDARFQQASAELDELSRRAGRNPEAVTAAEIQAAEEKLSSAIAAFTEFQLENDIQGLTKDRSTLQALLQQVKMQRDALLLDQAGDADDPLAELDHRLADLSGEADRLAALLPELNLLKQQAADAQRELTQVRSWLSSARQAEEEAETAHAVEIIRPAEAPTEPASSPLSLYAIVLAAGLALGLLLALSLEYISAARRVHRAGWSADGVTRASSEHAAVADSADRQRADRGTSGGIPAPSERAEPSDRSVRRRARWSADGGDPAPSGRTQEIDEGGSRRSRRSEMS